MKKLLLICSCFISCHLFAQEIDIPYDFPVKPGSEQWQKLSSSKEMDEVCIIPDNLIKKMSTRALLVTCLNYPRIIDIFIDNNVQAIFDFYCIHFNGLEELINRPDLNQVLIKCYNDLDIQQRTIIGFADKFSQNQIGLLEILIAQKKIINTLNSEDIHNLLLSSISNLNIRKDLSESLYRQLTTALILSRIIDRENKLPSEFDTKGNDIFATFNSFGIISDTTITEKLILIAKKI